MTTVTALLAAATGVALVAVAVMGERVVSRSGHRDRTTVVYWEKWTGAEAEEMRKVVDAFNRSQDRIFVKYLSISGVDQKTMLATAGGDPPDVAGIWQQQVFQFADAKALTDLTPLARESHVTRENYIPAYYDALSRDGRLWALPCTPASVALYVRPDLVPSDVASPETFPKTLEGLDRLSDRITKRRGGGIELAGFLPSEPGWWTDCWSPLFGGDLMKRGRPTLDTPEFLRALTWAQGYAKRYGSEAIQTFQSGLGNFSSPEDPFMSGKVATEMNGTWKASYIAVQRPKTPWFAVPFPYPEDRKDLADHSPLSQDVLVIPRGAHHLKEAWEFVRYVQRQDVMEGLCIGHGKNSPLARVSDGFWRRHPNKAIRLFDRLARAPGAITPPRTGFWPQMSNEITNAFQEVYTGVKAPRDALRDAQTRVDGLWRTYQEQVVGR